MDLDAADDVGHPLPEVAHLLAGVPRASLMDGTFTTMPMDELTKAKDVIRFMCKKHALNNESEWGLIEQWDHPGLPGGMSERKLPSTSCCSTRRRCSGSRPRARSTASSRRCRRRAFQLVLRKQSSLLPQARTKKEQHLEFCQALVDMRRALHDVQQATRSSSWPRWRSSRTCTRACRRWSTRRSSSSRRASSMRTSSSTTCRSSGSSRSSTKKQMCSGRRLRIGTRRSSRTSTSSRARSSTTCPAGGKRSRRCGGSSRPSGWRPS